MEGADRSHYADSQKEERTKGKKGAYPSVRLKAKEGKKEGGRNVSGMVGLKKDVRDGEPVECTAEDGLKRAFFSGWLGLCNFIVTSVFSFSPLPLTDFIFNSV